MGHLSKKKEAPFTDNAIYKGNQQTYLNNTMSIRICRHRVPVFINKQISQSIANVRKNCNER
jgi:hypothetical protein